MVSGLRPSILGVDHWFWMILIPKQWWHSDGKAAGWLKLTPSLDGYPNQYSLSCLDKEPSQKPQVIWPIPQAIRLVCFSSHPTAPGRTPICPVESKLMETPGGVQTHGNSRRICPSAGTHEIGYDTGMFWSTKSGHEPPEVQQHKGSSASKMGWYCQQSDLTNSGISVANEGSSISGL